MIRSGSLSRGMTRSSDRRKSATPTRSTSEWNGTSMPGTRMNDLLPPVISRRRSTSSSSASRPRTVPAIAYCEPRRLKLTICRNSPGALRNLLDERRHVGVVEIDLRRPDRGQPVVGPAQLVARHDVMHLRPTLKHRLQQRFQPVDARSRRPARCTRRRSGRTRSRPRRRHPARASRRPAPRPPSPWRPG